MLSTWTYFYYVLQKKVSKELEICFHHPFSHIKTKYYTEYTDEMYMNQNIYFQQNTAMDEHTSMPNLIPYAIIINVVNFLIKDVVVLVKF